MAPFGQHYRRQAQGRQVPIQIRPHQIRPPAVTATAAGEPRVLRVGGTDWITVGGCRTGACATHAGVLLVRGDGAALLARLDDGGFSHYYAFGTGLVVTPEVQLHVDAAWRALGGPPPSR